MTGRKVHTLLVLLVDASYSMLTCKDQTISGFNEYLGTMQNSANADGINGIFATFNTMELNFHQMNCPISEIQQLTNNFDPNGGTPLYDAVLGTIEEVEKIEKSFEQEPSVLIAVITDGEENSSRYTTAEEIKSIIAKKEKENNWTFVYLGANQDAWQEGGKFGMAGGNTMNYNVDDIAKTFRKLAQTTVLYTNDASASYDAGHKHVTRSFFQQEGK